MRNKSNLYDGGDGTSSESEDVESDDESSGTDQDTHYELQKPDYISPEMRDFITADQNVEMWGLLIYKPPRGLQHLMTASERNSIRAQHAAMVKVRRRYKKSKLQREMAKKLRAKQAAFTKEARIRQQWVAARVQQRQNAKPEYRALPNQRYDRNDRFYVEQQQHATYTEHEHRYYAEQQHRAAHIRPQYHPYDAHRHGAYDTFDTQHYHDRNAARHFSYRQEQPFHDLRTDYRYHAMRYNEHPNANIMASADSPHRYHDGSFDMSPAPYNAHKPTYASQDMHRAHSHSSNHFARQAGSQQATPRSHMTPGQCHEHSVSERSDERG